MEIRISSVGLTLYFVGARSPSTYDHRTLKTRLPVRSALFKQRTGGLVVRWVTTSEYPLLYVFVFLLSREENTLPLLLFQQRSLFILPCFLVLSLVLYSLGSVLPMAKPQEEWQAR